MQKKIIKLILLNIFLFTCAVVIYAVGYEYDKANKIYPEMYFFASDASIMVYGKRWERISKIIASITVIIDSVAIITLYMQNQREDKKVFSLMEKK